MTPAARSWLAQPELARLWDALRGRLQRNGIAVRGSVQIADASHAEREALGLLMGRAYASGAINIALADLDRQLRSGAAGCGLPDVVAELRGPLTSRPAVRESRAAERERLWAAANEALQVVGLDDAAWVPGWLDEIRRGGTLTRLSPDRGASVIAQAIDVLARVMALGQVGPSRGELAERVTGTAHGLDD
jgi:hypothetical protein